jgi:ABC-type branched-subunit amino acid transport system permease subunit
MLIYGVIIVLIIRFMPEGLISLPRRLQMRFGKPR